MSDRIAEALERIAATLEAMRADQNRIISEQKQEAPKKVAEMMELARQFMGEKKDGN
jgi:hypothetical protein